MHADRLSPTGWQRAFLDSLQANASDPASRFLQLATVDEQGLPAVRTVTWRGFDARGRLRIGTDRRSSKVRHLASRPAAELCAYLSVTREQYRIGGSVTVVTADGPADDARAREELWVALSPATRAMFLEIPVPAQSAPAIRGGLPPLAFVLLLLEPERVDHLDTRPRPHSRTVHVRRSDKAWESRETPP